MLRKKRLLIISAIGLLQVAASCENTQNSISLDSEAIATLNKLKHGFHVTGNVTFTKSYYEDSSYNVPSSKATITEKYYLDSVYSNIGSYTGVDRRFYKVDSSGKKEYLSGENAYDDDGYVGINYLDYDNTIKTDGYSRADGYNKDPYATSGYINPFLLVKEGDFDRDSSKLTLSKSKTNILINYFFMGISNYVDLDIPLQDAIVSDDFSSITISSDAYNGTEYDGSTTYYDLVTYTYELSFSEIGSANAKDALQPEPDKPENEILGKALKNMVDKNLTCTRHYVAYDDGEKVDEEETITTYNDGTSIYMQVYDYDVTEGKTPTVPTANDVYLTPKTEGGVLYAYVYDSKNDDGSYLFTEDQGSYSTISGYYYYDDFFAPNFDVSEDIFNKNDDGSFSPTDDNTPYIGAECFVPSLNTSTEIAYGYITSVKIYVDEKNEVLDKIVFRTDDDTYTGYTSVITLTYSDIGNGAVPWTISLQKGE